MSNDYNGMKRSELPDSVFGIPQERKYPMPDEKHTRSAIKLFNHVEPKYEEQLAKAVIKNMKKYNIDGSVVGPNNRLRKYLPKDMLKESSIEEGFLKSDKDIYYNKDKFDSGEINLCFITGLSGSGKSTMGRNMSSKNIEHYEMDDVICNDNFSDDNLKEYGGLISSFFKGAGKSFRLIQDDDKHNDSIFNTHKNYEKEITQAFVKHAISYCKSHKGIKYVCDGIWIFMFIKPEQLKDCAVYIKGTSSIKSGYRALKRDIDEDKRNGMTSLQIFKYEFKRVKEDILYARENQKELRSFRSYFEKQSTNESSSILPQDTRISTVIFDIGDVLVSANIKDYLVADPEVPNEIVDKLLKLWFLEKDEIDDTMDLDTYREIVNKRMGTEFSKYIPNLFKANIDCVDIFDYTIPMIQDLKDKGYKVYFLSNWSAWTHDLLIREGKFDFLSMMDGGVFSFSVGYMKPHEEIYKILLNRYKIDPEKAIFFDGKEENIEAAKKLGIKGVVFNAPDSTIVYNALKSYSVREIAMETIYCKIMNNEISKNLRKYSLNEGSCLLKNNISKKEIKDIQTIIESLDNNDFDNFKFNNIVYWDIRYRLDKPIAFITIRTKSINDLCVGSVGIAVNPKYRNQGIATSMAMKAIKWFKSEKGLDFLEWATTPSNEVFKKLAEKDDFKKYIAKNKDEYIHYTMESHINEFNLGKRINKDKAGREIVSRIRNKVLTSENYKKASKLDLNLKCTIENIDSNIVCVLILDGDQSNRDTMEAKNLLSKIRLDISPLVSDIVSKISTGDGDEGCLYFTLDKKKIPKNKPDLLQEYGTTGGTIVGANQPNSVYIVNYMQNNVFSGYKEPKQAICKKGMNQMYTTKNGKAVPVDKDKFKEEASDVSVFRFKETPVLSFDKIIENASVDEDFFLLLTGDFPEDRVGKLIEYDNRFIQEENFFDELDDITYCTESTIIGQIEATDYPYMKILTESMEGRCWNYYRDINGVFAMNELTGLRTPSYEDITDIPNSQIQLIERGTVYFGE